MASAWRILCKDSGWRILGKDSGRRIWDQVGPGGGVQDFDSERGTIRMLEFLLLEVGRP